MSQGRFGGVKTNYLESEADLYRARQTFIEEVIEALVCEQLTTVH